MAGTITTTTDAKALEWPGQSYMDRKVVDGDTGTSFMVTLTGTTLNVWKQQNSLGGWVTQGIALARTGIIELGGFFIDTWGYGHLVYRVNETSMDRVLYRRINLQSAPNVWGSELLVAEAAHGGTPGSFWHGSDVVAVASGTCCLVVVASGFTSGTQCGLQFDGFKVAVGSAFPSSTTDVTSTLFAGTRSWRWTGSGYQTPSLDLQHNGNGHTSSTPHLWVTIGRVRSMFGKMIWASGKWNCPSSLSTFAASNAVVAQDYNNARWDGVRFLSTVALVASPDVVTVHERNSANTATVIRTTPTHPQGNIRARAINYEYLTKDIRVYAVGTSTAQLYFVDYNRAAGTWGSWAQFSATALHDVQSWGVRRGSSGRARFDVYWQPTSGSPYTLAHVEQALSFAPATPGILYPASGQALDVGGPLVIGWTFSDPDPGGTQSAYALSKQEGVATIEYWNAGTGLWQASEAQNASGAQEVVLQAGWGVDGDATHNYKVKVWDNDNTPSGYSAVVSVVPSSWTAVTITTPASGAVLTAEALTPVWTVAGANQTAVNLRLYKTFDQFGRTTANGWGTSNHGAVWTCTGGSAADFLTGNDGGGLFVGTHTTATTNVARFSIADATSAASDVTVDLRCPVTPAGASIISSLVMFYVDASNYWRADVTFNTSGTVQLSIVKVVAGSTTTVIGPTQVYATHSTGRTYSVRMAWANGRIMAKLWDVDEPNHWTHNLVQAEPETQGSIGVRTIRNTSNSNGSQLMRFDNMRRTTLDKVYDSGWMTTVDGDFDLPYSLPDVSAWTLEVAVQNGEKNIGRWPARHFTVDYVEPPVPTLAVVAVPGVGALRVTITNPAPGGGEPAFQSNDVYRKVQGEGDEQEIRFATQLDEDAVWDDHQAVSGVDYLYKVRTFGVNGTRRDSAWT